MPDSACPNSFILADVVPPGAATTPVPVQETFNLGGKFVTPTAVVKVSLLVSFTIADKLSVEAGMPPYGLKCALVDIPCLVVPREDVGFVSGQDGRDYPDDDYRGEWLSVSDHGNATLYVRGDDGQDKEIWGVVEKVTPVILWKPAATVSLEANVLRAALKPAEPGPYATVLPYGATAFGCLYALKIGRPSIREKPRNSTTPVRLTLEFTTN